MDLQAIRTELVQAAPSGWTAYDSTPGNPATPSIVVGMPRSIDFEASYRMARVQLPIYVVTGPLFSKEAETSLLTETMNVAAAYRSLTGSEFRSCRVDSIEGFTPDTVGNVEAYTSMILLDLLVST